MVRYLVHMCQSPKVQVVAVHSLVCIQIHPRHEGRTRNRHAPVVERDNSVFTGGVGAVHQDTGVPCRQCINAMNANEAVFGDGLDLGTLAHVYRVASQYPWGHPFVRCLSRLPHPWWKVHRFDCMIDIHPSPPLSNPFPGPAVGGPIGGPEG